ncbi:hypothetical protein EV360DRAFT_71743 [Lentinula raphanica]|nr:hypothetical protein EV360DRAFT_71743 [Lentinula raphanica]
MLLPVSSRLSSILWLAMCLLSITVIARPIDQVNDASTANLPGQGGYGSEMKRKEIGHFHFKDEDEGEQLIFAAERSAAETQASPEWSTQVENWKYLNDFIVYLCLYDAVDEKTLKKWQEEKPEPLLKAVANERTDVLASRRITEQVSVRINGELFIPPERKTPITSWFATYHPIAKLRDDVKIDFVKLREDAEKHLVFLSDGSEAGAKEKKKGKVAKEGAASGSAATFDPNEWMYADGLLDGLWKQDAIDSNFPKFIESPPQIGVQQEQDETPKERQPHTLTHVLTRRPAMDPSRKDSPEPVPSRQVAFRKHTSFPSEMRLTSEDGRHQVFQCVGDPKIFTPPSTTQALLKFYSSSLAGITIMYITRVYSRELQLQDKCQVSLYSTSVPMH